MAPMAPIIKILNSWVSNVPISCIASNSHCMRESFLLTNSYQSSVLRYTDEMKMRLKRTKEAASGSSIMCRLCSSNMQNACRRVPNLRSTQAACRCRVSVAECYDARKVHAAECPCCKKNAECPRCMQSVCCTVPMLHIECLHAGECPYKMQSVHASKQSDVKI
jgi:hypothetical protein